MLQTWAEEVWDTREYEEEFHHEYAAFVYENRGSVEVGPLIERDMARAWQIVTAELAIGTTGFSYDDYDRALIGHCRGLYFGGALFPGGYRGCRSRRARRYAVDVLFALELARGPALGVDLAGVRNVARYDRRAPLGGEGWWLPPPLHGRYAIHVPRALLIQYGLGREG